MNGAHMSIPEMEYRLKMDELYIQAAREYEVLVEAARQDYLKATVKFRWITYSMAAFCFVVGALNLYSFFLHLYSCG